MPTKCNYPDCDGGNATGYCHVDCCPVVTGLNWKVSDECRKQLDEIDANIRHAYRIARTVWSD